MGLSAMAFYLWWLHEGHNRCALLASAAFDVRRKMAESIHAGGIACCCEASELGL
jgi:hypothetical protein